MKTEEIALSRLTENEENPRQITKENFAKLVKCDPAEFDALYSLKCSTYVQ